MVGEESGGPGYKLFYICNKIRKLFTLFLFFSFSLPLPSFSSP